MQQPYWRGNRPIQGGYYGMTEFVDWLTGTHKCDCGAKYKVTVIKTPHR
jgi:hypothetical protein